MEDPRWTTSPEQLMQARHASHGVEEEKDEYELAFDAIDADINLDESTRENPLYALSGHSHSVSMNGTSEGVNPQSLQRPGDRWSTNSTSKPAAMTLKEQEKVIEALKTGNFELKLKVYFLEERLAKLSPEHLNGIAQENVDLKTELQRILSELRQYKELLIRARATIASLEAQKNCDLQHGMTEEQEEEFRAAIAERLDLRDRLKQLTEQIEALEQEMLEKDQELEHLRARLAELEAQAEMDEDLKAQYEEQIRELQDHIQEYQQNESRLLERPREDEGWKVQCLELEQELAATQEDLSQARTEMIAMNRYMEQQRDELAKSRMDAAKLSRQLEGEREHMPRPQDDMDLEELRKRYEQLQAHCQELTAWREEDAIRHEQQLEDLVAELDDRAAELAQTQDELQDARAMLHAKDDTIAMLEDRIKQLEMALQDADAIHDEAMAKMKAKLQAGSVANLRTETAAMREYQNLSQDLALSEERNIRLETKLKVTTEQRIAAEALSAEASDQIAELTNALNDRDNRLRYYEEQESQLSKEIEARLKLNADFEATKSQVMDLMQVVERNKAAASEKSDLLDSQAREMDRMNMKARRLNDSIAALEEEKEQLETELRDRATTIAMLRSRLTDLELQLSKKQRDDDDAGESSKNDLAERNSLLLSTLQHLESILGDDGRLDSTVLPKPSTNFSRFSNHLLARLRSLSELFVMFEKKAKELEGNTVAKLIQYKKQMNNKLKQFEDFEGTINNAIERQKKLRSQLVKKQTENEELQAKQELLAQTIAGLKERTQSRDRSQERDARYKQLEFKLQSERARFLKSEELWNARIRELERRTKDAEEGRKRDHQGYKKTVEALKNANKEDRKTVEGLMLQNAYQQELINTRNPNSETPKRSNTPSGSRAEQGPVNLDQLWEKIGQMSKALDKEKEKSKLAVQELESKTTQLEQRDEAIKNTLSKIHRVSQSQNEHFERRILEQIYESLYRSFDEVWE
ncbi:hypothetical protein B0O80DRAFT_436564 [Mortierella sp. GBAus27b]|nr:hypothetical protein BGX31_009139 [Mortierella sp. GBA43]KAI8361051.1 hypothetical protein B0O80DRAFT_436564 [Mortierella sp. GBAus27b]